MNCSQKINAKNICYFKTPLFYKSLPFTFYFQIYTLKPAKMLETILRSCCDSKMSASDNCNSITSHDRRKKGLISRTTWTNSSIFNLSLQCFILVIFLQVRTKSRCKLRQNWKFIIESNLPMLNFYVWFVSLNLIFNCRCNKVSPSRNLLLVAGIIKESVLKFNYGNNSLWLD